MNFFEKYSDLKNQKKIAWDNMQKKRSTISGQYDGMHDICMGYDEAQEIIRFWLNDPTIGQGTSCQCKSFCDDAYCKNQNCKMQRKNHEYIDSVKLYKSVKAAQRDLVLKTLHLRKK